MSNIENLLRRQYEGIITPEEQSELDRLTHREQVIEAASRRAKVLQRRQVAGITGVASVLIVAGVIFFSHPSVNDSKANMPIVAQADVPEVVEPTTNSSPSEVMAPLEEIKKPISVNSESVKISSVSQIDSSPVVVHKQVETDAVNNAEDIQPIVIPDSEPIVACNTACSPDSVINDIWKFLRT